MEVFFTTRGMAILYPEIGGYKMNKQLRAIVEAIFEIDVHGRIVSLDVENELMKILEGKK